jgi:hypothetical protein
MKDAHGNELQVGDLVYADSPTEDKYGDQFVKGKIINFEERVILVNPDRFNKEGYNATSFVRAPEEVSKQLFEIGDRCMWVGDMPPNDPNCPRGVVIGEADRYPDNTIPGNVIESPAWVVQFDNLGIAEVQLIGKNDPYLKPSHD